MESLRNRNGSIVDRKGCPVLQEPLLQGAHPPWPSQTQPDYVHEFGTWNVFHAAQCILSSSCFSRLPIAVVFFSASEYVCILHPESLQISWVREDFADMRHWPHRPRCPYQTCRWLGALAVTLKVGVKQHYTSNLITLMTPLDLLL